MATLAEQPPRAIGGDDSFFMKMAIIMALIVALGFSFQLAMGRSTFRSPPLVHAHAITFMGWVAIYVTQNVLNARDHRALHRQLGWLATFWVVAMIVLGFAVTLAMVRRGGVPFFFTPLQFLVFDPLAILTFAGLTWAAVALRRRTEWHRRLHYTGLSLLLGPAFGRLLPGPLLIPYAFEVTFIVCMAFPVIGMVADKRRVGRVHPAWYWGLGAMIAFLMLTDLITYSPVGTWIYDAATAGSPGALIDPLAYPPMPPAT
jgi:hypothetical protein